MKTKNFLDSLAILLASPSSKARRAASCLVCAQVVKAAPIPSPEECDAETLEITGAVVGASLKFDAQGLR